MTPSEEEMVSDMKARAIESAKDIAPNLGTCATCGFLRLEQATGLYRCLGVPNESLLLPPAKKITLSGQQQSMELRSMPTQTYPNRPACAFYDPQGMSKMMLDVAQRFTFTPSSVTDQDREFIKQFLESQTSQ